MSKPEQTHWIEERRSPSSVKLFCTCGWTHAETRHQNALARASKLRSAELRHLRQMAQEQIATTEDLL